MKTRIYSRLLICTFVSLAIFLAMSGYGYAEDKINFEVIIVKASRSGNFFDPALRQFKKQLQDMPYKSFKLERRSFFKIGLKEIKGIVVAQRITAQLQPRWIKNQRIAFNFKILKGKRVITEVNYSLPKPGLTIIVGPGDTKQNRYLIIIKAI